VSEWRYLKARDYKVSVKSSQAVENYNDIKFFKEDESRFPNALAVMEQKQEYKKAFETFLKDNEYTSLKLYSRFKNMIEQNLLNTDSYYVLVKYVSPTGRKTVTKTLDITNYRIQELEEDKSILMTKGEYSRYLKAQEKDLLEKRQHAHYEKINQIIDDANKNKEILVNKNDVDELDKLIASLFDRTVNSIKKIKNNDSDEWNIINKFIAGIEADVKKITDKNNEILEYYNSEDFTRLKSTCDSLMSSQREFNEYIDEKVKSISGLFGTNIVREDTVIEDEYNYIHPYKKSLTPFTAEVSASVFASAENNPLDYVVKQFYSNKSLYPEQIQKLQLLVEELETLKEAKQIIENQKAEIQQYLSEVPDFIMENDEDGFYSRLGFATINENSLVVAYKFSYTSNAGYSQRSFNVPMTEGTIVALIQKLEDKLTFTAFAKEQRSLMTSKLRQQIKERDKYTCQYCGNSINQEPNLLLEIDHKIPVSKGGLTEESNLQTLCWRCNRTKSDKLIDEIS
jgi:rubrerythrin